MELLLSFRCRPFPLAFGSVSSLIIISFLSCSVFGAKRIPRNETDRLTLLEFKASLSYPLGVLRSWNTIIHYCQWYGVTCGPRHRRVTVLDLQSQNLGGIISPSIGNLTFLRVLNLQNNSFHSRIPPEVGHLYRLRVLHLNNNSLDGPIPPSLSRCFNLVILHVNKMNELFTVGIANNHLGGQQVGGLNFLCTLTNSTKLESLQFKLNNFEGNIPECISNMSTTLMTFSSGENMISGGLPGTIGNLINLELFFVEGNNISGNIPSEIGNLARLKQLYLGRNEFSEEIPHTMGNLSKLIHLSLRSNSLQGAIPSSLSKCQSLLLLDLAGNKLSGAIPPEIMEISSLSIYADFSSNNLTGKLPMEVGNLKNLGALLLQDTRISGEIPSSLGSCIMMENLYMQDNLFEGLIPSTLSNLKGIQELNLSNNMLSGKISKFLEGLNLTSLGLALNEFEGAIPIGGVFRNTVVAVKVLNLMRYGAAKSFISECEALRNIRHRNLVKVITACSGTDSQGNDFKALIYEFMVNGILDGWLHLVVETIEMEEEAPRQLNLLQRLNIAIDVASALDYLHNQCNVPIVHCDLKPSNVLLDDEMTAHEGDFGLVRFMPEATKESVVDPSSSISVKGSFGYIAPEYGAGGDVSTHGDVYSYGILVLEMFTGKRRTDEMFTDGLNLHLFANAALPEQISQVIDSFLLQECRGMESSSNNIRSRRHRNKFQKIQECLVSIIRQGVVCSSECPQDRMNVADVAATLRVIQKELLQAVNQ
ncbi:hypothetical protein CRG98_035900 [Punica granatum]|uniref:non-specific serine/threonine protein kinase n=1 Tax=Punica granatum TaxID=22663 RepID=A0A2I0II61_PUNGR|nr:hypothetical protein CRG98_035900 [Punica granatum]